ncbi:MAG: XRE family transcriptional regulator [Actinomycetota bacterium]|nr:XRE family transcriptional regulator [Actinomycetota bacterium]
MSLKEWEQRVLANPGAEERVSGIESELRLATGLTALRKRAGLSQREMAKRLAVSQPRVVAIERSENVTVSVLEAYLAAIDMNLEITAVHGAERITIVRGARDTARQALEARGGCA